MSDIQTINVIDPEGNIGSLPQDQAQDAIQAGYREATPQDIHDYRIQQKYGTPSQQAITAAEGAGRGSTFGLSTGLELGSGLTTPEDIQGRQEANPVASTLGEIGGIAGSSLIPGIGEANILEKAGAGGARALGLTGTGALSKIGAHAVKSAIETGMVQGGDEVSKMFMGDPNQTAGTAMVDIGLSSLLGGGLGAGFGAVSPLWTATVGDKFGGFLGKLKNRVNGEPIELPTGINEALDQSGLEVTPEVRSALSQDPEIASQWQRLQESQTSPGLKAQKSLKEFQQASAENVIKALGRSTETIPTDLSENEVGSQIQKSLSSAIDEKIKPLTKQFEDIKNTYSQIPVGDEIKSKIADDLGTMSQKEGYGISEDSPQNKTIQSAIRDIKNVKTLEDLRKLNSIIGQNTYDVLNTKGLNQVGRQISQVFRANEDGLVEAAAGAKSPEMLQKVRSARSSYGQAMGVLDDLNDRLHVGNYGGGTSFVNSLNEMKPEDVLRRLNPRANAGTIDLLAKEFPDVAGKLREFHLDRILSNGVSKARGDMPINTKAVFNSLDKLSPEMRNYLLPAEQQAKLSGTRALLEALPDKLNPSGTAKTLDSLWSKIPGGAMALASMLMGHNPAAGFILGQSAKWLARDAPDAIRLAFLKFLGHSGPVDPPAFKAMVEYAHSVMKGEAALNKGVSSIFKAGAEVFPRTKLPDNKKLDNRLQVLNANPQSLLNTAGKTTYYLPDHGSALATIASNANNYLNSIRPSTDKPGMLDEPREPSMAEKQQYDRALTIAEKPLEVLNSIKEGTIVPQDIVTLKSVYPNLYERMSHKLMDQMTTVASKGSIPYKTRIGLSMFLGMPLDASMTPIAIQLNQPIQTAPSGPQVQAGKGPHKPAALNKMVASNQTPGQAREAEKTQVHS